MADHTLAVITPWAPPLGSPSAVRSAESRGVAPRLAAAGRTALPGDLSLAETMCPHRACDPLAGTMTHTLAVRDVATRPVTITGISS